MNFEKISEQLADHDLTPDDVEAIANSVGMAYAEGGSKVQHIDYEPDEVKTGLAAPVPEDRSHEETVAVLQELCWESVEQGHAKRKESYAREDE
jgi:hypothetical protein